MVVNQALIPRSATSSAMSGEDKKTEVKELSYLTNTEYDPCECCFVSMFAAAMAV
jgi:hypothetical protein